VVDDLHRYTLQGFADMLYSVVYAIVLALLTVWLSLNVIKIRRHHQIKYGDGGVALLEVARAAHANAAEYIPISLLLLFALEYNHGDPWLLHGLGCVVVIGRLLHARGLLADRLKLRTLGIQLTLLSLIGLSIANLYFLSYHALH
jgi:uncharacterized membrane protein YecN with MAPEG domain